jgi:hypothetical protein
VAAFLVATFLPVDLVYSGPHTQHKDLATRAYLLKNKPKAKSRGHLAIATFKPGFSKPLSSYSLLIKPSLLVS